jgi:hypothetical protein
MPTGYTAPVQDGTITELSDFILSVARGWMPMVLLRDSDQSLDATKRFIESETYFEKTGEDSYNQKVIRENTEKIKRLQAMTDEEALAASQAKADEVIKENAEYARKKAIERGRYETMIAKVEAWEPPSENHVKFKEYMLEQLRESLEHDCGVFSMPVPAVSVAWRDNEISRLYASVARAKTSIEEARERNEARREWVVSLLNSLEGG